ncbi:enoyl-CoA hydratase-related protein [Corynebacterium sp. S7]
MVETRLIASAVWVLTINRDEKRNALNVELCTEIGAAMEKCVEEGARTIVLTGAGSVFSAGADLDEKDFHGELYPAIEHLIHVMTTLPIPLIAYVNGPAIGAGTMLAMACDIRIASPLAGFRLPVSDMAIGVDSATVEALESLVGGSRARAMLLYGWGLPSSEAVDCGFALQQGSLDDAIEMALELTRKAPLTVKQLRMEFARDAFSNAERNEAREAAWNSDDRLEVARARKQGRDPKFTGR